ncbi:YbaY family lipoprotein [Catenovulum sp. 2E275]|uniref:YbaY family lipoprotein n=1 Tax=Catenovulum sp. 2E275 TaxID=2980497 RepID=UPI0021D0CB91|nr:YbaY family lipoprotein [Catenovulum sp. 2E275]MCU4676091.1 YbaY family lipoprotein [Catenovulum sp. 2E275]
MRTFNVFLLGLLITLTAACQQSEPQASVTGKIGYLERIALTPNSHAIISLYDVSIADKKAELIAEQKIDLKQQQVPVAFELNFASKQIRVNGIYSVRAVIKSNEGKLLWTTDTVYPIDTRVTEQDLGLLRLVKVRAPEQSNTGNPVVLNYQCGEHLIKVSQLNNQLELVLNQTPYQLNRVVAASGEKYQLEQQGMPKIDFWLKGDGAMLVVDGTKESCQLVDDAQANNKLSNSQWYVAQINNMNIMENTKVTVNFSEQKIYGSAGCNQYTADYQATAPEVHLSTIAVTKRACLSAELAEQESRFLTILGEVNRFKIENGTLILDDGQGNSLIAQ